MKATPKTYAGCEARLRELNNVDAATEAAYEALKASQAAERAALHAKMDQLAAGKRKPASWAVN